MPMVKQITVNTNEIYPVAFLKDAVLNRSLKGAMSGSVGRVHFSKPFISIKKTNNDILKQNCCKY